MPTRIVSVALRFALPLLFPLLGCLAAGKSTPPPELPVEVFAAEPALSQLKFSPSGKLIAALMPYEKRLNLVIMDPVKKSKRFITAFKDFGVSSFVWGSDDRLLLLLDQDGSENYMAYGINADGTHFDKFDNVYKIVGPDPVNPGRVIVYAPKTMASRLDACSMDLKTGALTVLAKNPGDVENWVLDQKNVVRFGIASSRLRTIVYYRASNDDNWTTVEDVSDGQPSWVPQGFDSDNRTAYVLSNKGRATNAVFKYDTQTHTLGELVSGDPIYDVTDMLFSRVDHRVTGVMYEADKPRQVWIDKNFARRQQILDQAFPGAFNLQVEATADGSQIIVVSKSDRDPGVYYVFDEKRHKIEELAVTKPKIDPEQMAEVTPFEYEARDGLLIRGYITFPLGRERRNLPMIIHPHGGPFGPRDIWSYDPQVQLLANRGFIVVQPNYRGSGGYGGAFERRGYRQWGRAMQDDLTDVVNWAIKKGYADPSRVVILGASYGGYAVMAGLTFTPELYCAGVNYVGVTDLKLIARQGRASQEGKAWRKSRLGDLNEDSAELEARSPVNFAANIRVPVLMAYGKSDPRVTREHGDDMASALKKHGKVFEYHIESDEGHGYRKEENRLDFYRKVDSFLKRNVRGIGSADVSVGTPTVVEMPAK